MGSVRGGVLALMACWNLVRNSWFGVSADPQKSSGRIGGTLKVRLKLETASNPRGADPRPKRMMGSSLVQEADWHLAWREAFSVLWTRSIIPFDSGG